MKILILGANGILGHTLFLYLQTVDNLQVLGLCGKKMKSSVFSSKFSSSLSEIDLLDFSSLENIIKNYRPDFVVNCAVKKSFNNSDEKIIENIYINSILPHRIAKLTFFYQFNFNAPEIHFNIICAF